MALKLWLGAGAFVALTTHLVFFFVIAETAINKYLNGPWTIDVQLGVTNHRCVEFCTKWKQTVIILSDIFHTNS
jgi:hypothetical protein